MKSKVGLLGMGVEGSVFASALASAVVSAAIVASTA